MQLPDYHEIIEHPMDFATVRKKLSDYSYSTLEQLEVSVLYLTLVGFSMLFCCAKYGEVN